MIRRMMYALALIGAGAALAPASQAQGAFGCACLSNRVGQPIQFQYRIGNGPWNQRTLLVGHVYAFCQPYGAGPHTSAPLHFMLDRDAGPATAMTDYNIQRVQSHSNQCAQVPAIGQYYVAFQANTNNQMLIIHRVARPH